jgi:hypothetical protein
MGRKFEIANGQEVLKIKSNIMCCYYDLALIQTNLSKMVEGQSNKNRLPGRDHFFFTHSCYGLCSFSRPEPLPGLDLQHI